MLRRVDVGVAGVRNREVQPVRRRRALQEMVWGARMLRARLTFGVAERAHRGLLEPGWHAVGLHQHPGLLAPGLLAQRFRLHRIPGHCGRERRATAQEFPAVEQSVAGDWNHLSHAASSPEGTQQNYTPGI